MRLTVSRADDTISRCALRFWAKFQALRPLPPGREFAKSPGCDESMGGVDDVSEGESPGCGWWMALSIRLNYTGTKPPELGGVHDQAAALKLRNHGKDT